MDNFFKSLFAHISAFFTNAWNAISRANVAKITASVATDAELIKKALNNWLGQVTTAFGVDTTAIQAGITNVVTGLEKVTTGLEANVAQPILQQVANDWTLVSSLIKPEISNLSAVEQEVFKAVETLLPYVTAAANIITHSMAQRSADSGMSADEARVILAA